MKRLQRFGVQTHERTRSDSIQSRQPKSAVDERTSRSMSIVVEQLSQRQKSNKESLEEKKVEMRTERPTQVPSPVQKKAANTTPPPAPGSPKDKKKPAPPPVPPRSRSTLGTRSMTLTDLSTSSRRQERSVPNTPQTPDDQTPVQRGRRRSVLDFFRSNKRSATPNPSSKKGTESEPTTPLHHRRGSSSLSLESPQLSYSEAESYEEDDEWKEIYSFPYFENEEKFRILAKYVGDELATMKLDPMAKKIYLTIKNANNLYSTSEDLTLHQCIKRYLNPVSVLSDDPLLIQTSDFLKDLKRRIEKWDAIYSRPYFNDEVKFAKIVEYIKTELPLLKDGTFIAIYKLILNTHTLNQAGGQSLRKAAERCINLKTVLPQIRTSEVEPLLDKIRAILNRLERKTFGVKHAPPESQPCTPSSAQP